MSKKIFFLISLILLPFIFIFSLPSQDLYFIACNVGQGDAILLTKGFTQVLIDGGPNDRVLNCLSENMPFYDRQIELLVNTHPDADHVTGLVEVLRRFKVKQVLAPDIEAESNIARQFDILLEEEKVPLYAPEQGEEIKLSGLKLTTLWPNQKVLGVSSGKTNENSIVLHLQYGDFDALLTGDITSREEEQIIKNYQFDDIEVLKVAHHGSKYSSSEEFLEAVDPDIAVISVGKNSFGHPAEEVLEKLQGIGAKVLRTDKEAVKLKI